jgi:branched-chain amino acid transport system permease protein
MSPNAEFSLAMQLLFIGIMNGGIYTMLGLGLTVLFGVSGIVNMAHGEVFAGGGYVTFVAAVLLGVNPILALGLAAASGFVAGWAFSRWGVASFRRRLRGEPPLEFFLILTMGLSLFLQNSYLAIFGADNHSVPSVATGGIDFFGITMTYQRLLVVGITAALVVMLFAFLNRTRLGTAIRAVSQDRAAAQAVGIDIGWIDSIVFGVSVLLGAAAGSATTAVIFLYPQVGSSWLIGAFVAVIAGGLGNPVGTLIAGYSLGILESLSLLVFPAQFKTIVGLTIMIVVLVVRPAGLLGQKSIEQVG